MSVQDRGTIDYLAIESGSGRVVLAISDHLDWTEPKQHLYVLQEKLNTYISFVESGQVWEEASTRAGKEITSGGSEVVVRVFLRHEPPQLFHDFLDHVNNAVQALKLSVHYEVRSTEMPSA
ncbi:MAG: hypothetical protein D6798_01040 [Deltaproteobacteria bacterium]|nr:MAG: hypothetical protein D6798_01040 [Deltaproteobacteria bacterium]